MEKFVWVATGFYALDFLLNLLLVGRSLHVLPRSAGVVLADAALCAALAAWGIVLLAGA